jgi:hypothetical protein
VAAGRCRGAGVHDRVPGLDAGELAEAVEAAREGRSGAPKRLFRMIKALVEQPPRRTTARMALLE